MKEKRPRFKKYEQRAGEVYDTNEGYKVRITEYRDFKSCDLVFEHDSSIKLYNYCYNIVQKGAVRNPMHKSLLGVGYLGMGEYKSVKKNEKSAAYSHWSGMIGRCYNEKTHLTCPTYKDCTVDERWHNFQVFAKWYYENFNLETMQGWHLDKDILKKGNKVYSPDTCCFVPLEVNSMFKKRNNAEYPPGVKKSGTKFIAVLGKSGKRDYLGTFNTPKEAFLAYKPAKEEEIKRVADKWKNQIDPRVYKAMYEYIVEITD